MLDPTQGEISEQYQKLNNELALHNKKILEKDLKLKNMIEEFDAQGDMKSLFKKILGSNVTIKDNLRATEVNVFCLFIQKLEESKKKEDRVFEESGIELKEITDPLWMVIESTMKMIYGVEAVGIIFWYLYERYNPDGTVIDFNLYDSFGDGMCGSCYGGVDGTVLVQTLCGVTILSILPMSSGEPTILLVGSKAIFPVFGFLYKPKNPDEFLLFASVKKSITFGESSR